MNYRELLSTCFIFKTTKPATGNLVFRIIIECSWAYLILYIPILTAQISYKAQIEISLVSHKWLAT
jgi:hypothetical protein